MIYAKPQLLLMVEQQSLLQETDPALISAIIDVLSEWHPERVLINTDIPHNPALEFSAQAETTLNVSTLGLMQFSGAQARGLGYLESLDELLEPELNLKIGIALIKKSLSESGNRLDRALVMVYGYRVASSTAKVFSKIKPYHELFHSSNRPEALQAMR